LSNKEARYLILVIAMANYPTKLSAGKVIDLSFSSFGMVSSVPLPRRRKEKNFKLLFNLYLTFRL